MREAGQGSEGAGMKRIKERRKWKGGRGRKESQGERGSEERQCERQ